jgi:hypothetical protein
MRWELPIVAPPLAERGFSPQVGSCAADEGFVGFAGPGWLCPRDGGAPPAGPLEECHIMAQLGLGSSTLYHIHKHTRYLF